MEKEKVMTPTTPLDEQIKDLLFNEPYPLEQIKALIAEAEKKARKELALKLIKCRDKDDFWVDKKLFKLVKELSKEQEQE
jgi:hypothetical protein